MRDKEIINTIFIRGLQNFGKHNILNPEILKSK